MDTQLSLYILQSSARRCGLRDTQTRRLARSVSRERQPSDTRAESMELDRIGEGSDAEHNCSSEEPEYTDWRDFPSFGMGEGL